MNIPEKVVALGRMGIYLVLTGTEHCGSGGSALDNFFGWARTEKNRTDAAYGRGYEGRLQCGSRLSA